MVVAASLAGTACASGANDIVVRATEANQPPATTTSPPPPSTTTAAPPPSTTATAPATSDPTTVESSTPLLVPATTEPPVSTSAVSAPTTPATLAPGTLPLPAPPESELAHPFFGATNEAFEQLARANTGASLTVVRGGEVIFSRAAGQTLDGHEATGDTPMVVASVSKIVVALGVARLHQQGFIDIGGPVPWDDIGLAVNPAWYDVTIRELLDHRSGLEKARFSWFNDDGDCRTHVTTLLEPAPSRSRGEWVYSNGNYCILGLLLEQRTGLPLDQALQALAFDPVGVSGIHLTDNGLLPGDQPHAEGVDRLSRLGGAGTLIVSTDDTALLLGRMTPENAAVLLPPGVFTDQYGFGHTGTVDGAKACIWVLEGGATVVSATIAGNSVNAGGAVCDIVVPAIATDLGINAGRPDRTP
ncbi:MAG: CubicO group peptidase (beta-lactamase class C family) [Candidatus Aldehydirespiratoraceae bacterium]|jgi:CubicO group peptidase (beta-lactamase class C family)